MHFADEIVGIISAGIAAFMASKAKQSAEKGSSSVSGAIRDAVSQRLPKMFGIGRIDEQLLESLRQLLDVDNRRIIDTVIGEMMDYESDIFRLTVTGMSCGSEVIDEPVRNPKGGQPATTKKVISWELTENDLRVKYLKDIVKEVSRAIGTSTDEKAAVALVIEKMRSRRLITRSPAAQKAYELWVETTEWVKKDVLELFEVTGLAEITPTKIAGLINKLGQQIPDRPSADVNPGFWRRAFQLHPVRTVILILGIILITMPFAFV